MSIRPRVSLLNPDLKRPSALHLTSRNTDYFWLDKNENIDPELMSLTYEILSSIPKSVLATYPEAGELYRKLSHWMRVSPESLLITPGSDGVIRLVFEVFIEPGDVVLHTSPTFAMYPVYCQMFGARAYQIEYSPTENGPYLDPVAILEALQQYKPKLLCLPNPDSPTGTILKPEIISEILAKCEFVGSVLLLDEAYHPFYDWSGAEWTRTSRNLIIARTFAKAWGAAGLRIGYAVAHPETSMLLHKMKPMYESSTLAVEFMTRMLDRVSDMRQAVERINASKLFFQERMHALGFKTIPTLGNFTHVAFDRYSVAIHKELATKVLYRPTFEHPSLQGYSRFSIGPQPMMEQVVTLIQSAMEREL